MKHSNTITEGSTELANESNAKNQSKDFLNWNQDYVGLLRSTVARNLSDHEIKLFKYICQQTGLDPLLRQIYAMKKQKRGSGVNQLTFQTGIDGYRVIAERSGEYAGSDEPMYRYLGSERIAQREREGRSAPPALILSATVTVYRIVQNQKVGFTAIAYWDEYAQYNSDGSLSEFWRRMPHGQLAKCSEALALRKAFPTDLSGIYTHEEMQQANLSETQAPSRESRTRNLENENHIKSPLGCEDLIIRILKLEQTLVCLNKQPLKDRDQGRRRYCGQQELQDASKAGLNNYLRHLVQLAK